MSARATKPARERIAKRGVLTNLSLAERARRIDSESGCAVATMSPLLRYADRDRRGLDLDREGLDLLPIAAVDLVENLAVQLDLDLRRRRRLDERRAFRVPDCRAGQRAHPVGDPVCVDDADLEPTVVGTRVFEHLEAA